MLRNVEDLEGPNGRKADETGKPGEPLNMILKSEDGWTKVKRGRK